QNSRLAARRRRLGEPGCRGCVRTGSQFDAGFASNEPKGSRVMTRSLLLIFLCIGGELSAQEANAGFDLRATVSGLAVYSKELTHASDAPFDAALHAIL